MMDDFGTHMVWAALLAWLLQQVKQAQSIPWITQETGNLNRWIGALAAIATGLGVHLSPIQWDSLTHTVSLSISGLDFYSIADGLWGAAQTFVIQQVMYHGVIKK